MNTKLNKLEILNKSLNQPKELPGEFLPAGHKKKFDFMFVAEMPSMNEPEASNKDENFNFGEFDAPCRFLHKMMIDCGVDGSYVTDIVKQRDIPRRPTKEEIQKWLPFLLKEVEIIQPKYIVVLGKTNYMNNFEKSVEPAISEHIKIDWVYHYSQQGAKTNAEVEQKFSEVIDDLQKAIKV